jgi:hypothetical protein
LKRVIRCSSENTLSGKYVKDILRKMSFKDNVRVQVDKDSVTKYDIPYGGFSGKVSEVPWFFSDLEVDSANNDGNSVRIRVK